MKIYPVPFEKFVMRRSAIQWLLAAVTFSAVSSVSAQSPCGDLKNAVGPFDYRFEKKIAAGIEFHHFNADVEALRRGQSTSLAGDIQYLLFAVPNHHRALASLMRLGRKMKSEKLDGLGYPIECYFDRALRFQPNDAIARLLYADYLLAGKRTTEAGQQLELAKGFAADNPFTQFNIGLMYLILQDYPRALTQAHRAIELGFVKTDLKDRLVAAGQWVEPALVPPALAPAAPALSAASSP